MGKEQSIFAGGGTVDEQNLDHGINKKMTTPTATTTTTMTRTRCGKGKKNKNNKTKKNKEREKQKQRTRQPIPIRTKNRKGKKKQHKTQKNKLCSLCFLLWFLSFSFKPETSCSQRVAHSCTCDGYQKESGHSSCGKSSFRDLIVC